MVRTDERWLENKSPVCRLKFRSSDVARDTYTMEKKQGPRRRLYFLQTSNSQEVAGPNLRRHCRLRRTEEGQMLLSPSSVVALRNVG